MPGWRQRLGHTSDSADGLLDGGPLTPRSPAVPPEVTADLRNQQSARASRHLVPAAHAESGSDHGGGSRLVRVSSAEKVAEKLGTQKRRDRLAAHTAFVLADVFLGDGGGGAGRGEFGGGGTGTSAAPASGEPAAEDAGSGGNIAAVPGLNRLSLRSAAVAVAPRPAGYTDCTAAELRELQ
eukprot:SAG22_NODE_7314_length_752_cov_1.335375_1_plen_180_part_10